MIYPFTEEAQVAFESKIKYFENLYQDQITDILAISAILKNRIAMSNYEAYSLAIEFLKLQQFKNLNRI